MSTIFKELMQMVAAGLGFEIDSFRTSHEYALTTEDSYTTPGLIKKGHVGGQHFNYEALVGDRTVIEFKTYWRMADKLTPAWNQPMTGLTYIVEIEGDPGVRCVFEPVGERPAELGLIFTAPSGDERHPRGLPGRRRLQVHARPAADRGQERGAFLDEPGKRHPVGHGQRRQAGAARGAEQSANSS